MNSASVFIVLLISVNAFADAPKNGVVTRRIPLDQIWAYKMPGTRDIQELGRGENRESGEALVNAISIAFVEYALETKNKGEPRSAFAVPGTGLAALREAHSVFVENAKPREKFLPDEEVTIVFFSEPAGGNRPQLREVLRRDDQIELHYRLEPFVESNLWAAIALVPVGKLPSGQYQVNLHQLPSEKKFIALGFEPLDKAWARRFLCKLFSFNVVEKER